MIRQSADDFFTELDENLLLIGEEVQPTKFVADRIDLLAVDREGVAVIIEIKRGADKLQLLQALPYAAMLSKWTDQNLRAQYQRFCNQYSQEPRKELSDFLGPNVTLNQDQRIILLAEDFDYEVLATAEWLTEQYGVDLRCFRLALATDNAHEFLTCTCVFPPPEIGEQARIRGPRAKERASWVSWDAYLGQIANKSLVEFVREQLQKRSAYLGDDPNLRFLIGEKTRYQLYLRKDYAYVWQWGRFDDDITFWKVRLREGSDVRPVSHDTNLRFILHSPEDFKSFVDAVDSELKPDRFKEPPGDAAIPEQLA
jgi:hypothetical protein